MSIPVHSLVENIYLRYHRKCPEDIDSLLNPISYKSSAVQFNPQDMSGYMPPLWESLSRYIQLSRYHRKCLEDIASLLIQEVTREVIRSTI